MYSKGSLISGKLGVPLITDNLIDDYLEDDHTLITVSSMDIHHAIKSKKLISFNPKEVSFPDPFGEENKSVINKI